MNGDLGREERVGRQLDQLRRGDVRLDVGAIARVDDRLVDLPECAERSIGLSSDDDPGRRERVLHRPAFTEEFRIRRNVQIDRGKDPFGRATDPFSGSDGHRGLLGEHRVSGVRGGDRPCCGLDRRQVRFPGLTDAECPRRSVTPRSRTIAVERVAHRQAA